MILQSYLFAGFPRTLNAAREWRRISGTTAPAFDTDSDATVPGTADAWRARGEVTCAAVYGDMYDKLRVNIAKLHPALDHWMVTDGYGKGPQPPGASTSSGANSAWSPSAPSPTRTVSCTRTSTAPSTSAPPHHRSPAPSTPLADLLDDDALRRYRILWGHVCSAHSEQTRTQS